MNIRFISYQPLKLRPQSIMVKISHTSQNAFGMPLFALPIYRIFIEQTTTINLFNTGLF